jgi:hypothetical protein
MFGCAQLSNQQLILTCQAVPVQSHDPGVMQVHGDVTNIANLPGSPRGMLSNLLLPGLLLLLLLLRASDVLTSTASSPLLTSLLLLLLLHAGVACGGAVWCCCE